MFAMKTQPDRRSFIIASGLTALASTRVLGANDILRIGVIGAGGRMGGLLNCCRPGHRGRSLPDCRRQRRLWTTTATPSKERPNGRTPRPTSIIAKCSQQDIDAVLSPSPDHWHVRMAVDALAAGKDVYLEKPVTHTIEEGATLTRAVRSSKQILAVWHAAAQLDSLSRRRRS